MAAASLRDHLAAREDPRQSWKTLHPLEEILLIVFGGVMAGADDLVEIPLWGRRTLDRLRPDRAEPGLHRFPGLAAIGAVVR